MKGIRGLLIKDLCLMGEIRKLLLIILFVTAIFIFNGTSSTFLTGYIYDNNCLSCGNDDLLR